MTDPTTEPAAPSLEFQPYPQEAANACRSTRHCADHGYCRRCQPEFAAVMSKVNAAIRRTGVDESHWGPLYAAVGEALRPSPSVGVAALRDLLVETLTGAYLTASNDSAIMDVLADAVLPLLPAPADRAAVLTEAADAPAAECSAQHRRFDDGRLCIRAAQHRGDHIDERGFHWSDTVAVYPAGDGTFREGTNRSALLRRLAGEVRPETTLAGLHGDDHSCAESGCSGEPTPDEPSRG